jgi:hypothetical protein
MSQIIIFNQDNGTPAVVIPTQEALNFYSILEIAIKDVPAGKKFKIVNATDLQTVAEYPQESWVVDEADLTDGTGGESNEFN